MVYIGVHLQVKEEEDAQIDLKLQIHLKRRKHKKRCKQVSSLCCLYSILLRRSRNCLKFSSVIIVDD